MKMPGDLVDGDTLAELVAIKSAGAWRGNHPAEEKTPRRRALQIAEQVREAWVWRMG